MKILVFFRNHLDRFLLLCKRNIVISGAVHVKGRPIIIIHNEARLILEDNVTLNSRSRNYHAFMHSPVKILVDRAGALVKIGKNSRVNGACIHACESITIGENCLIAANVQIFDSNGHDKSFDLPEKRIDSVDHPKPIVIGDSVWIGVNSIILPGVIIGEGAIIGANTVVTKHVPARVMFAGNPGVVVKKFDA